ncbi:MAG: hypothetical protein GVY26_14090, partial [Bacteroidetes bacterium]|nr:hypothetical protein [Bacteroidota bacterium]
MKHVIALLFFLLFLGVNVSHATVFAGEITFRQTAPLEIEASVYLYIRESAVPPQANYSPICWGDGNCTSIPITNGDDTDGDGFPNGQMIGHEYRLMVYTGTYTYEEAGTYTLSVRSYNRPSSILNMNSPNSDQVPFHTYATVQVAETAADNHAPILYEHPLIDEAVAGFTYRHTPNAFDPDGDEIRYQLETPTIDSTIAFPYYELPDALLTG